MANRNKTRPRNSSWSMLATYLRATNQVGDAAKKPARNPRSARRGGHGADACDRRPSFAMRRRSEKELAADLKQLELDERLGKLVLSATWRKSPRKRRK